MSTHENESLQPVGISATEKAVEQVLGSGPRIDIAKYNQFTSRLVIARPTFVRAIDELGMMRVQQGAVGPDLANYRAGAALYYGAVQQRAKEIGVASPKVKPDTIPIVVQKQFDTDGSFIDLINLFSGFASVEEAMKLPRTGGSPQEDFEAFFEASGGRDTEAQALVFDENAAENIAILERAFEASKAALATHVQRFTEVEEDFVGVMEREWWDGKRLHPTAIDDQRTGGTDAFQLVEAVIDSQAK